MVRETWGDSVPPPRSMLVGKAFQPSEEPVLYLVLGSALKILLYNSPVFPKHVQ